MAFRIATTAIPYTELEVADGNFDDSRATIDRVVIHTMVGSWQGAAARFDNPSSGVSAHYGVKLDGGLIHWLEETKTAYHADDYSMNQRSIGIEHEDGGDYNGVRPDALYNTSVKLVADICQFYGIPCDRDHIKKHNEVSDNPTSCPDALDIDRIVNGAHQLLNPATPPQFADQTKIPASLLTSPDFPVSADMEIQAIRGKLGDFGRYMKAHPDIPQTSPSVPQNPPKTVSSSTQPPIYPNATTIQTGSFLDWLKKLLGI